MMGNQVTAIYLRLSIEDDGDRDESNSISSQRMLIESYIHHSKDLCESRVVEYCDDGYSGTSMERPGIKALLEEVKKGKVHCIIVKDLSRFSRDYITSGDYLDQIFPFMGVRFISINDGYDSKENKGSTMEMDTAFKTMLYDFYSKDTSVKVMAAHKKKQEQGVYMGMEPLGYIRDPKGKGGLSLVPEQAELVRRIFDMALGGMSAQQIAVRLQEEGTPTPVQLRGRKLPEGKKHPIWDRSVIRTMLNNRFYLGEMVYNKYVTTGVGRDHNRRKRPREEWKAIPDHHDAIITEEEYQQVVSIGKPQIQRRKKHPLIGVLICGGCGYHIARKGMEYQNNYFRCTRKYTTKAPECVDNIPVEIIEEAVLLELTNEIMLWGDPEKSLEDMQRQGKQQLSVLRKTAREYQDRKKSAEKRLAELYEQYSSGELTSGKYMDKKTETASELAEYDKKESEKWEEYYEYQEELKKLESDMKNIIRFSHIETLTEEIVETFIDKIYLHNDKRMEIVWKFQTGGAE